jgi:hypothetical protein
MLCMQDRTPHRACRPATRAVASACFRHSRRPLSWRTRRRLSGVAGACSPCGSRHPVSPPHTPALDERRSSALTSGSRPLSMEAGVSRRARAQGREVRAARAGMQPRESLTGARRGGQAAGRCECARPFHRRARGTQKGRRGVRGPDHESFCDECSRPQGPRFLDWRLYLRSGVASRLEDHWRGLRASIQYLLVAAGFGPRASVDSLPVSHHISTVKSTTSIVSSTVAGARAARAPATARSRITSARGSAAHPFTDSQGGRCDGRGGTLR